MAETYGELICRLCRLRDEMNKTPEGRAALHEVKKTLRVMRRRGVSYAKAAMLRKNSGGG